MIAEQTAVERRFSHEATKWDQLYQEDPTSIYAVNLHGRLWRALELLGEVRGNVLEIGCGPGTAILRAMLDSSVRGFASDLSRPMLERARSNARDARRPLRLLSADAARMPIRSESVNAILCLGVVEYLPADERAIHECYRMLQPGGTLIVSVPNGNSPFVQVDDLAFNAKNSITRRIPGPLRGWLKARLFGREDKPYFNHKRRRYDPTRFEQMLRGAGFRVDRASFHTYGLGVLKNSSLNTTFARRLDSQPLRNRSLEKTGWTYIVKAIKPGP